jgi:ribosomal protein L7/L12
MITRINYHLRNTAASLRMAADELDKATQVGYENQPGFHLASATTGRLYGDTSSPDDNIDKWQVIMGHIRMGNKIQAIKAVREYTNLGLKEAKSVVDTLAGSPIPQL